MCHPAKSSASAGKSGESHPHHYHHQARAAHLLWGSACCTSLHSEAGILRSKKWGNKVVNHVRLPSVNKQCKWDRIHHFLLETQRLSTSSHPTNQDSVRAQNRIWRIDSSFQFTSTFSLHRSVSWLLPWWESAMEVKGKLTTPRATDGYLS